MGEIFPPTPPPPSEMTVNFFFYHLPPYPPPSITLFTEKSQFPNRNCAIVKYFDYLGIRSCGSGSGRD